jgi:uncharacterized protein (TIGR03435 family)
MRLLFIAFLATTLHARGQTQFEVTSVKPSAPAATPAILSLRGTYSARGLTLRDYLRIAVSHEIPDADVSGGPNWIYSARFDIDAKIPGEPTEPERNQMLAALLSERFGLKFHRDEDQRGIFELVTARGDGRLGPKLRPAATCEKPRTELPHCVGSGIFPTGARFRAITMDYFADFLSRGITGLGRPFVDRTGLTGDYDLDFDFQWKLGPPTGPEDEAEISFATALQEQLGLKLRSAKGTATKIVIDAAHPPDGN